MITKKFKIIEETGIHARPASIIIKKINNYDSEIKLNFNGKSINLKSMISLMSLGLKKNDIIEINIEGEDEEKASFEIEKTLLDNKLGENLI